jgi:hypothetical protein
VKVVLLKTTVRHIVFCVMDVHDAVIMIRIILIRAVRNHTHILYCYLNSDSQIFIGPHV